MLIDTHKVIRDIQEAGASEELAEAIADAISSAEGQVATKKEDLQRWAIRILLGNAAVAAGRAPSAVHRPAAGCIYSDFTPSK